MVPPEACALLTQLKDHTADDASYPTASMDALLQLLLIRAHVQHRPYVVHPI